jgi:hypothetical protein
VSFLNQLKTQAKALQTQQERDSVGLAENTAATEKACDRYTSAMVKSDVLDELAKMIVSQPHRFA